MTSVVVVESPAKAKTINKYLGDEFKVLASYGHIRDLPSKDGSVRPDENFSMDWEVPSDSNKHIKAIADALKGADKLYLATDPDREGEAISWHVQEVLRERKALKDDVEVKRVVFNEITKSAIQEAFKNPRELDQELIDAYLARRALDYLVGFSLSPVLWRKLPGSRSAGRVQSVALRLICTREAEIEDFKADEYWTVDVDVENNAGALVTASLTHLGGGKLAKLDLGDKTAAEAARRTIEEHDFKVSTVERKQAKRNPAPPFTTSTLQMEASRKLGFTARRTMQVAQKLYEGVNIGGETVGLITYMRTDGVSMANEAIFACRDLVNEQYGKRYVPESPRIYKSKAKNAQEAHEAIRPTDVFRRPDVVSRYLDNEQLKLYELIWKRTLASQMEQALIDQVGIDLEPTDGSRAATLRATGSVVAFDGFLKLYFESKSDTDKGEEEKLLPDLTEGEDVKTLEIKPEQHFTQPPPRYSEASLVKRLEELGIGRPSTYASILSVLQDRNYVRLDQRRFMPEDRGRLVTTFLEGFFERYVEYNFTAEMESKLDDISGGRIQWKKVLDEFWGDFSKAVDDTKELRISTVIDFINEALGPHFFRPGEDGSDPRKCPSCADGRLGIKFGRNGAFVGCSNYPECKHTRPLEVTEGQVGCGAGDAGPKVLGQDPESGKDITLRRGPYGHYVQLGEAEEIIEEVAPGKKPPKKPKTPKMTKPKRKSLLKNMSPDAVDLDMAVRLLGLPRHVGDHPETGDKITADIGPYGPYVKMGGTFVSLKGDDDVLSIGMNRAVDLINSKPRKDPPKELGPHPDDKKVVTIRDGRYGPYVQHGTLRATIPKDTEKDSVTLEQAVDILKAKAAKGGSGSKKKAAPKKKPAAKKRAAPKKKSAQQASE